MKQFKFRAWHPENKSMILFDLERASKDQFTSSEVCALLSNTHSQGKDLMMQFTGLTDKLGTEIYEGDILQPSSYTKSKVGRCVVVFKKGMFCFDIIKPFVASIGPMSKSLSRGESANNEFVVIGNKFENPELLPSPPEAK